MRFSIAAIAALPLLAIASPLELIPRATDKFTTIMMNLTNVNGNITQLNKSLNAFADNQSPNFYQAVAVQTYSTDLSNAVNSTTATVNSSSVVTAAEASKLQTYFNSTLVPAINSLLQNFIAHYPAFKNGSLAGQVENGLIQQKELAREQGNALKAKIPAAYQANSTAISNGIQASFNKAIAVYSK